MLCAQQTKAQEPNEAEALFLAAEKKLADADTVQITVKGSQNALQGKTKIEQTYKGTVLLAKANKARVDYSRAGPLGTVAYASVSNGGKMWTNLTGGGTKEGKPVVWRLENPENANALLTGVMTRAGLIDGEPLVLAIRMPNQEPLELTLDDLLTVHDFTMGKVEKVGDRKAQRIDYKLQYKSGFKRTVGATIWLDSETNLPLKRAGLGSTETYEIRLNGKIDAKMFALPK